MIYCSIDNCDKPYTYTKPVLMCPMHYQRSRKHLRDTSRRKHKWHYYTGTPEYYTWNGMKQRCLNPNNPKYKNYGARGIQICSRWLGVDGFTNFIEDMGKRPSPVHTIDRINNDGNYEPSNCRWATKHQQVANRTISNPVVGVTKDRNKAFKNKWSARLYLNNNLVFYGRYATESEAIAARKDAEKKYL